jgi:hypothetical protein
MIAQPHVKAGKLRELDLRTQKADVTATNIRGVTARIGGNVTAGNCGFDDRTKQRQT